VTRQHVLGRSGKKLKKGEFLKRKKNKEEKREIRELSHGKTA